MFFLFLLSGSKKGQNVLERGIKFQELYAI